MRLVNFVLSVLLSLLGCGKKDTPYLFPKPQHASNEFMRITYNEPTSIAYKSYLRFEIDMENLTARPLDLQITGVNLVTPTDQAYAMFDESTALAYAGGGFGYVAKSRKTGETIDTNSEEYVGKYLLRSTTIPAGKSIRRLLFFPFPELGGSTDTAFQGIYRIVIEGLVKGERAIPFPQ